MAGEKRVGKKEERRKSWFGKEPGVQEIYLMPLEFLNRIFRSDILGGREEGEEGLFGCFQNEFLISV